jgi:hypothetical protein
MGRVLILAALGAVLAGCTGRSPDQAGVLKAPPPEAQSAADRGLSAEEIRTMEQRPR